MMKQPSVTSFYKKETGAIAIMFAFFLIPFLTVTSMSIEVGRFLYAQTRLSYAVDAAVIAAAKYDLASAQTNATNIFQANFPSPFMGVTASPTVTLSQDQTMVTATATGNMPTILGKYFNINALPLNASATVLRTLVGLEVALVLDNTGSMLQNGKIAALKSAASNFMDIIFGSANTRLDTGIAIVPYIMSVNVGSDKTAWLSDPATVTDTSKFPLGQPWKGCVKNRYTVSGSTVTSTDINDNPPSVQLFDTYFAESTSPYHLPNLTWDNDWIISGTNVVVQHTYGGSNVGPNQNCGDPIMPLTNDKTALKAKINSLTIQMGGTDGTRIVWGWRVISPRWTGLWGGVPIKSYTASNNIKAIVMMTDGVNEVPPTANTGAPVTAYETRANPLIIGTSRLSTKHFYNTTTNAAAATAIDTQFIQACNAIKGQGIQIYTVLVQVNNANIQNLYKQCATTPTQYYAPTTTQEIYDAFTQIANSLNRLRITQ